MQRFASPREAKEFLISRIVSQAEHEGVPLSEVERKMLYFSETGWAPLDMVAVNDEFERHYSQSEFERKMAKVIRDIGASIQGGNDEGSWEEAVRTVRTEDHYLLVLIDLAGRARPRGDFVKLVLTALVIVAVFVAAILFFGSLS